MCEKTCDVSAISSNGLADGVRTWFREKRSDGGGCVGGFVASYGSNLVAMDAGSFTRICRQTLRLHQKVKTECAVVLGDPLDSPSVIIRTGSSCRHRRVRHCRPILLYRINSKYNTNTDVRPTSFAVTLFAYACSQSPFYYFPK